MILLTTTKTKNLFPDDIIIQQSTLYSKKYIVTTFDDRYKTFNFVVLIWVYTNPTTYSVRHAIDARSMRN